MLCSDEAPQPRVSVAGSEGVKLYRGRLLARVALVLISPQGAFGARRVLVVLARAPPERRCGLMDCGSRPAGELKNSRMPCERKATHMCLGGKAGGDFERTGGRKGANCPCPSAPVLPPDTQQAHGAERTCSRDLEVKTPNRERLGVCVWWWSSPLEETSLPHGHCHRRRNCNPWAFPRGMRRPPLISPHPWVLKRPASTALARGRGRYSSALKVSEQPHRQGFPPNGTKRVQA